MPTLFVNNLTQIDASLLDPERGLVGITWLVDLELHGELDTQGMVLDFGEIKPLLKGVIDGGYDHRLLVPLNSPQCRVTAGADGVEVAFTTQDGGPLGFRGPREAVALVAAPRVTPAAVAEEVLALVRPRLPDNVRGLRLQLLDEPAPGHYFHYSHGLQQHSGNCQRIAHGHRSRLEIWRDGQRDAAQEARWCGDWRDIYLGSRHHLLGERVRDGVPCYRFGYDAPQGRFELELPQERCRLVGFDSTVENLAGHLADRLHAEAPGCRWRVRLCEGLNKGAIAEV
jgi:6-pyruvoyl-tetrahydropterin synthase